MIHSYYDYNTIYAIFQSFFYFAENNCKISDNKNDPAPAQGGGGGLVIPSDDPLAKKKTFKPKDLIGLPLFCSRQAWENEIAAWAEDLYKEYHLEGSFKLSYNGAIFAKAGLGYLLTFDRIVDTSEKSGLVFRPLSPKLETKLYLVWKKYQTLTPIAERFLTQIQSSF